MKITIEINDKAVNVVKSVFTKRTAIIGIIVLFFIGGVFVFSQQAITKPNDFSTGDVISAEDMNENFDALYAKVNELDAELNDVDPVFGYVPVGSIVAWHKSLEGTPVLPEGWVECNGNVINDSDSLYYGQNTPNLNGEGRFLRGSDVSGTEQEATSILNAASYDALYIKNSDGIDGTLVLNPTSGSPNDDFTGNYHKFRPVNMSVVWIMRIK